MGTVRRILPQVIYPQELKVAAYCHVSTRVPEQLASLAAQERYYKNHIKNDQSWEFAGIYSDIGSGTTIKGRKRYNAMVSACRRGKIDVVFVKSAQHFARNTVNALETIQLLKRWN